MKTKVYATYLRVSTQKQGQTQLGLTSQRSMCEGFIKEHNGKLGKEFLDIESGTHRDRKGLWDAIEFCNKNHCPLVIATLSRLARDVEFCFKVINTGIEIHFVDMPTINTLLLGVFASVAQYERELTSDRTKKALAVKKAQGCKLGAASDKYKESYKRKAKEKKREEAIKRGTTRNERFIESRDTQVFLKVIKKVFPDACQSEDICEWEWDKVNTKGDAKSRMVAYIKDYKEFDESGSLFKGLDLEEKEGNPYAVQMKLNSRIYAVRRAVKYKAIFNN